MAAPGQPVYTHTLSCAVCGKERQARGINLNDAVGGAASDYSGWGWQSTDAEGRLEVLCPEHSGKPKGLRIA